MGQDSSIRAVGGKAVESERRSVDSGNAVVAGDSLVEESIVRIDHIAGRAVVGNEIGKEETRLGDHGINQPPVSCVLGIKFSIGFGIVDLVELEPSIEKLLDEALRFRFVQQTIDFRT